MGTDFWETPDGRKKAYEEAITRAYNKGYNDALDRVEELITGKISAVERLYHTAGRKAGERT